MTSKVKDFKGFMKQRLNESEEMEGMAAGMHYGANPEEEEEMPMDDSEMEGEDMDDMEGEEEEVTLEDLKAMVDDLTERMDALEGGDEEEEEDMEDSEEEEDMEDSEEEGEDEEV
jgi:hypothetical protein